MLYAFIQSSNYSNVYNILQPEALDLESYRKYIEQNHVTYSMLTYIFFYRMEIEWIFLAGASSNSRWRCQF